jgi:DNA-binding HxlR family transcriptional regulator
MKQCERDYCYALLLVSTHHHLPEVSGWRAILNPPKDQLSFAIRDSMYHRLVEYEPVRRVSRALFGHRYRLELLVELADAGEQGICVSDMAVGHGANASVFYPPLRELESIGLVSRRSDQGHGRRVYYTATQHGAWAVIRRLVQTVLAAGDGQEPTSGLG